MGFQPKDDNRLKIHDELLWIRVCDPRPANRTKHCPALVCRISRWDSRSLLPCGSASVAWAQTCWEPHRVSEDDQVVWIQPEQIEVYPIS